MLAQRILLQLIAILPNHATLLLHQKLLVLRLAYQRILGCLLVYGTKITLTATELAKHLGGSWSSASNHLPANSHQVPELLLLLEVALLPGSVASTCDASVEHNVLLQLRINLLLLLVLLLLE